MESASGSPEEVPMNLFALAVPMLLVLAACGAKDESATTTDTTPAATKTPSEEPASSHPTPRKPPPVKRIRLGGQVYAPIEPAVARDWLKNPNAGGVDIIVYGPGLREWTGPWPLDISKLRTDHTPTDVIFTLSFAQMNVIEGLEGDQFRIRFELDGGPRGHREIVWSLYPNLADGRVFSVTGDDAPINNCKFDASLDTASDSMRVQFPNGCLGNPDRLRAQASLLAPRYNGWYGRDATPWTRYTGIGQSSTTQDPAQAPAT
jgi:hypothetical protein